MAGTVYVHMLGGLEIRYNGEPLNLGLAYHSKVLQLFLILVWAGRDGISRGRLLDYLYDRSTTDAANALRVLASRLRKVLQASALPREEYILVSGGTYSFGGGELALETDAGRMEENFREAQRTEEDAEKLKLFTAICDLYQGEFLPSMSGELWVEIMRSSAETIYIKSVREACRILSGQGNYDRVQELCLKALRRCPMEDWRRILEENRVRSGSMARLFSEAPDLPERSGGASACGYSEFEARFREMFRKAERNGLRAVLFVCRLTTKEGREPEEKEAKRNQDLLCGVLESVLRQSDTYTRCGSAQVLVLGSGLGEAGSESVSRRIRERFCAQSGDGVVLKVTAKRLGGSEGWNRPEGWKI